MTQRGYNSHQICLHFTDAAYIFLFNGPDRDKLPGLGENAICVRPPLVLLFRGHCLLVVLCDEVSNLF
jgi:hypothetical protein